jgi:hypothetical protein
MSKRSLTHDEVNPELRRRVNKLLRRGASRALEGVMAKSMALCSGKGGVGKTITAANLAILYARQGLRVGLVDLDPLSDVATLLDVTESEIALEASQNLDSASLADYTVRVFDNLDLVFPNPKLDRAGRRRLLEKLFRELTGQLLEAYDLLVFDLPAGSDYEENLVFLPFMKLLVLVTNPEPTAHVAAGGYIRRAFAEYPEAAILLWHNRYGANSREDFNPRDVAGNYNRNVPAEQRLRAAEIKRLEDITFVPEDPALNLLRGNPGANENIHRFLVDTLKFCDEQRLRMLAEDLKLPRFALELVVLYLNAHGTVDDPAETLEAFGRHLQALVVGAGDKNDGELPIFSPTERSALSGYLQSVQRDALRKRLLGLIVMLEERLQELEVSRGPFAPGIAVRPNKAVDRELSSLLIDLSGQAAAVPELVRQGGLLVFYFSLYKLLQSATVTELIGKLVPTRTNARGARVRDRNRQIRSLIENDPDYRQRYLKAVRALYPVVVRQVTNMVKVLDLSPLILRGGDGKVLRSAYLKLLTNFLHDTLYSGLSVVVGFPYRAAGRAFVEGADAIVRLLGVRLEQAASGTTKPSTQSS